ncbi:MAG: ATP-binding protein [Lachnospiraceae bacterium]|nr:ATP-binding protein [Lachnospiraceae bacterium]
MNEIKVKADIDMLDEVIAFVEEQLEAADCPMKTQMTISVAVEELFVNIAHYAYPPKTGDAIVRMEVKGDPKYAEIQFIDSGIPYNPLEKPDPDITKPAEERPIGGLGIFMVKKSMDEMLYEYTDGKNIVTIRKTL